MVNSTAKKAASTPKTVVYLNSATKSFSTITYARKHAEQILTKAGAEKTRVLVTLDSLIENERIAYTEFQILTGITDKYIGIANYDKMNKMNYFDYPTIGLKDNKVSLSYGSDSSTTKAVYLPLVYNNGYTLNGNKVYLSFIKYQDNDEATPFITVSNKTHKFYINIKVDKEISEEHLTEAFNTGSLDVYLNEFRKGVITKFTNIFRPVIENGKLPHDGLFVILKKGEIVKGMYDNRPTVSSSWRIDYYDPKFAALPIYDSKAELASLRDATFMYASEGSQMTKDLVANNDQSIDLFFLVVTGKNKSGNIAHFPEHTGAERFEWLPLHIQNLFIDEYRAYLAKGDSLLEGNPSDKALSGSATNTALDFINVSAKEVDELIFQSESLTPVASLAPNG